MQILKKTNCLTTWQIASYDGSGGCLLGTDVNSEHLWNVGPHRLRATIYIKKIIPYILG